MILFSSDACMPACKYWRECFSATGLAVVAVKSRIFKSTTCVQKQVIRILCASLAYKGRVIRIHSTGRDAVPVNTHNLTLAHHTIESPVA